MAFFDNFLAGLSQGGLSGDDSIINLNSLLQPKTSAAAPAPVIDNNTINVEGAKPGITPQSLLAGQGAVKNPSLTPQQQADLQTPEGLPERKGMFGVKGTLRDVLGVLGDAFLVNSGANPVYAPRRRQEETSDAMYGFTDTNPTPAINRLLSAGQPELAQKLYDNYLTDIYRNKQADATIAYRDEMNQFRKDKEAADADEFNRRLEAQQKQFEDREARYERQFREAEAGRNRRDNPPAQKQPRAETRDERYIRLSDTDPNKLSRGEKAWLAAQEKGRTRGSGRGVTPPPATGTGTSGTTGKYVLRNGKFVRQ